MTAPIARPLVIKIGGTTVEDPAIAPLLWDALATLARSRPTIIVHGGGKAVDRLLERVGMTVERAQGLRITPPDQMALIAGVLAGTVNKTIVASLLSRGARAVGLCLGDGAAIPVIRKAFPGVDLGLVGEVAAERRADGGTLVDTLLRDSFTPVFSSIGIDASGTWLNLNADDAAAGVALHCRASALILMTDVPGILDEHKRLIPTIDRAGIESRIASGVISGGMIPKARAACAAAAQIGAPVLILSGNDAASLARFAAGEPAGTTINPA